MSVCVVVWQHGIGAVCVIGVQDYHSTPGYSEHGVWRVQYGVLEYSSREYGVLVHPCIPIVVCVVDHITVLGVR
jgi:hypothetical protein